MKPRVLLLNRSRKKQCGVYDHAYRMGKILEKSEVIDFIYREAESKEELLRILEQEGSFSSTVFNYLPFQDSWHVSVSDPRLGVKVGMYHDVSQYIVDQGKDPSFPLWLSLDPTVQTNKSNIIPTLRPLVEVQKVAKELSVIPKIGSFGFPFAHKGFHDVVKAVVREFDEAIIAFHVPQAWIYSVDLDREMSKWKNELVGHPGIQLEVSSNYLEDSQMVEWLSSNHINVFLYNDSLRPSPQNKSGVSSALDFAIPAGRPILISNSIQFRHANKELPIYPETTIKQALDLGSDSVNKLQDMFSHERFRKQHEDIFFRISRL